MSIKVTTKNILRILLPRKFVEYYQNLKYRSFAKKQIIFYKPYFENMKGIEVGGPSMAFRAILPIYKFIASLDGVNFSNHTIWEGNISNNAEYRFSKNKAGKQYIAEASCLGQIESFNYDFLLSSNCLEHVANPIKALKEWLRVIKPGGTILLVLPKKESNFDHKREYTVFSHLLDDYENDKDETDMTHLEEILSLHDITRDYASGTFQEFKARSLNNFTNRCLHHHVFDSRLIEEMFDFLKIEIIRTDETSTDYIYLGRSPT